MDLIVEFGGGYGSFARVVMNGGFRGRYVIYDLHPFNLIQKYYLKSLGWKVRTLDEWESYDSGIWMVHDLKTLKKLHLNEGFANNELAMFVAMFSLSEVTDSLKDAFMALGPSPFHNYLFTFNQNGKIYPTRIGLLISCLINGPTCDDNFETRHNVASIMTLERKSLISCMGLL